MGRAGGSKITFLLSMSFAVLLGSACSVIYFWVNFIHGKATLLLPFSGPQCPWNSRSPKEVRGLAGYPVLGLERHNGCRGEGVLSEKLKSNKNDAIKHLLIDLLRRQ